MAHASTIVRFGVGVAVYLPYALTGLIVEYHMEWVVNRALVGLWAVFAWCLIGAAAGLCADLAYRFLPARFSEHLRAIATGVLFGVGLFVLTLVALSFFYVGPQSGPGSFLGVAYYGLPLLLLNSGFGGYTAYAISRHV